MNAFARKFHNPRIFVARGGGTTTTTSTQKHFAIRKRELSYRFYPHFHPYAGLFTKRLIQKSVRGLQAIDTEYVQLPDGTFAVLPGSVRVLLNGKIALYLPDGTQLSLSDGNMVRLPGTNLGQSPNGLRFKLHGGGDRKIMEGEAIRLAGSVTVTRADGESITLNQNSQLTLLDSQRRPALFDALFSGQKYNPNLEVVGAPYPNKEVDFTSSGAYAVYNWELFYHVPLMIAMHLSRNQRFEDAQRWFHYIFDPTDDGDGPVPERYWKVKPFQSTDVRKIEEILVNLASGDDVTLQEDTINSIARWKENPFRPHVIARYRQTAYMLRAVTAYLDNLIAWGDSLFREDTRESIDESLQIYILAASILGTRPQSVPEKGTVKARTYNSLRSEIVESWSALVDIEAAIPFDLAPYPDGESESEGAAVVRSLGKALYFCVPRNDKLLGYWDAVADRLFKIHNSLNIQGVFRQLALFDPPIDPGLLAKAAAAGLDVGAVVSGLNQPLPLVRFQLLAQKALEICQEVKSLGSALLSAMEKEDNEAMALLRSRYEQLILSRGENVKYAQWQEAIKAREGLEQSLANAVQRYVHFERQLGKSEGEIVIPKLEAMDPAEIEKMNLKAVEPAVSLRGIPVDIAKDLGASGGKIISSHEAEELDLLSEAQSFQDAAAVAEAAAAALALIPKFGGKVQPFGAGIDITFGGDELARNLSLAASIARAISSRNSYEAGLAGRIGSFARREMDWAYQSNTAAGEIALTFKQLRGAQIREAIAKREWDNHKQQIKNAEEIERFLNGESTPIGEGTHKKTNTLGFYTWQRRETKGLYGQAFQIAFDLARKAERALKRELSDQSLGYLQTGYLSGKEGLFAAEKLFMDIKRMEIAYHDLNQREYELTKNVSLLQINPVALILLRQTGRCTVTLPEELFDMDGPGHYFRRIKSMSLSVPCVAGPYSSVNCTLTLLKSSLRINPMEGDNGYPCTGPEDSRFESYFGSLQSIVTSNGQNDGGMFEMHLRDERYLPFEGSGAISEWQLQLPANPSEKEDIAKGGVCQFDYDSIADVILHVRYTAREGGVPLRKGALENLKELVASARAVGTVRLFSIRHEFPTEWARFKRAGEDAPASVAELKLSLREEHYPLWSKGNLGGVSRVDAFAETSSDLAIYGKLDDSTQAVTLSGQVGKLRTGTLHPGKIPFAKPTDALTLYLKPSAVANLWIAVNWHKGS
jgi:hypothetical protein